MTSSTKPSFDPLHEILNAPFCRRSVLRTAMVAGAVAPHVSTVPGIMIFLVTLGLNIVGDALRDALDPRLRH